MLNVVLMTEPEELATAILTHLKNAFEEIEAFGEELITASGKTHD